MSEICTTVKDYYAKDCENKEDDKCICSPSMKDSYEYANECSFSKQNLMKMILI